MENESYSLYLVFLFFFVSKTVKNVSKNTLYVDTKISDPSRPNGCPRRGDKRNKQNSCQK